MTLRRSTLSPGQQTGRRSSRRADRAAGTESDSDAVGGRKPAAESIADIAAASFAKRALHQTSSPSARSVVLEDIATDTPVGSLGVGRQQMVEIAAALDRDCQLLILDEPTAALSAAETERLFEWLDQTSRGRASASSTSAIDSTKWLGWPIALPCSATASMFAPTACHATDRPKPWSI